AQEDLGSDALGADSPYARVLAASDCTSDSHSFGLFLDGLQALVEEHSHVVSLALPPPTLPASALFCFVQALFSPSGVALRTLQKLYAHLRAIPVGTFDTVSVPGTRVAPDEATKDILYLTTVAEVVALLLAAADSWAVMQPVGLPMELGRRCVFGAFEDVIGDYVQLERRIIERAYAESLGQWMMKSKERLNQLPPPSAVAAAAGILAGRIDAKAEAERPRRNSVSSARILGGAAGMESSRTANFSQRRLQMDEYKARVLKVLEAKLGISLSSGMQGIGGGSDDAEGDDAGASSAKVGLTKFDAVPRRWPSGGAQTKPVHQGRTVVGEVLWNSPVSIDLCLNMVLTNRDAIDRLAVFAEAPPDMRLRKLAQEAIESVFCILLQSVGNHVRPAFSKILVELKDLEQTAMVVMVTQKRTTSLNNTRQPVSPSTAPAQTSAVTAKSNFPVYSAQRIQAEKELREKFASVELRFFELIHLSDLVVQMLEIYYKKDMCMFIDESDFLNMCNQEKKALEHAIDDSVAVGMDCVIEVILRQTQHILDTEQHALDYHPDSNISLTLTPSLACTRAVQFLGESTAVLQSMTMQKQMRGVFMGEIGQRLFSVLLDNIKRFQITEPGGFQLIADLNLYYDWAASNVDLDTLRYFTALKDLANCFILAPRDLRGFLRDQYSRRTFDGVMRSEEVYDVVACRADYKQIRTQVEGHCDFM
ncbi:F-box protein: endocytic membrane traffic, recycling ReCYcling 1, partial [Kickxella alabastrina]